MDDFKTFLGGNTSLPSKEEIEAKRQQDLLRNMIEDGMGGASPRTHGPGLSPLSLYQPAFQPPPPPPPTAPAQRLADRPAPAPAFSTAPSEGITDDDRQKALNWVTKMSEQRPPALGGDDYQTPATSAGRSTVGSQIPPAVSTFASRYKEAAGQEQEAIRSAARQKELSTLFADAGHNMSSSGAAIRAKHEGPRFTASSETGQAEVDIAKAKKGDLLALEQMDPESERSKRMRGILTGVPGMEGYAEKLQGLSAGELERMFPLLSDSLSRESQGKRADREYDLRREQLDVSKGRAAADEAKQSAMEKRRSAVARSGEAARVFGSSTWKVRKEAYNDAQKGLDALRSGNPMAQFAVVVQAARASGEKGPLSETDQEPYRMRQSALGKIGDWEAIKRTGKLSPELYSQIEQLLEAYKQSSEDAMNSYLDQRSESTYYSGGGDPKDPAGDSYYGTKADIKDYLFAGKKHDKDIAGETPSTISVKYLKTGEVRDVQRSDYEAKSQADKALYEVQ